MNQLGGPSDVWNRLTYTMLTPRIKEKKMARNHLRTYKEKIDPTTQRLRVWGANRSNLTAPNERKQLGFFIIFFYFLNAISRIVLLSISFGAPIKKQ